MAVYYRTHGAWDSWTGTAHTTTVWSSWTGSDNGTSATAGDTWGNWTATNYVVTVDATVSSDQVWYIWSDGNIISNQRIAAKETEEQKTARLERERIQQEEWAREAELRKKEEKEREGKARQLLREVLTDEQNEDLDKRGHFELQVVGGSKYRIKKGSAGNVEKVDRQGKVLERLCFHARENLHHYDQMALQKLLLEVDEEQARRSANVSRVANG